MEGYILEWLNLFGRWIHLITGIAWIGASFYFIWLDNHLEAPAKDSDRERGVGGELWAVHGGGFYNAQKYSNGVPAMPPNLHWFKWEAYTTLITGAFLMALIYWYQAEIYLIDPGVMALSKPVAIVLGVLTLVVGWLGYDALCKSQLGQRENMMALALLVVLSIIAWGLCQVFSGRGAYMHFGAMLGTIMVANVYFVIMPGQRAMVAACTDGRQPDPIHGARAKQRSVHNTYFTLPVLFIMISNHYAMTWGHDYNWLILIAMSVAGALIRVHFVQAHFGKPSPIPAGVAILLLIGIVTAIAPSPRAAPDSTAAMVTLDQAHAIIQARCTACHATVPTHPGFAAPPKGVVLETPEQTLAQATSIHQQIVVTRAMPIGNLTGMTDEERTIIDRWYLSSPVAGNP
ncbi:MAG: urate hydroxylase PuuD [Granulosicoccus sp.]|nr:urate hydroxylase PuuD [Granulosicoccus sp.]